MADWMGGLQCGRDLRLESVGDLVGVAFQYSPQHAGNGLGQLALNGVGVHQIRQGSAISCWNCSDFR